MLARHPPNAMPMETETNALLEHLMNSNSNSKYQRNFT